MNILILTGWGHHDYVAAAAATLKIFGNKADVCGVSRRRLPEMLRDAGSKWGKIKIITADITTLAVDAIVNAANELMLGGGGVDGAIHWEAGEELFNACLKVPEVRPGVRCPTGEARITPGFKLPAKFVIHTVGPVYRDGQRNEPALLAACYRNSLALAAEHGLKTIAFPCISTGVYGYPIRAAAEIALRETQAFLAAHPEMEVIFCCYSERDGVIAQGLLTAIGILVPNYCWANYSSWMRTMNASRTPSEWVVQHVLRKTFAELLAQE